MFRMLSWYVIKSWRNSATRRFAEDGKSGFSGFDADKAGARLQLLDAVHSLDEVPSLSSINLHRLKGKRRRQWAMTINGAWRLVFGLKKGHAYDVEIADYR